MSGDPDKQRAAELLHLREQDLCKGDPIASPMVSASMYHLPGKPDGAHFYGRVDNPTWEELERALGVLEDAECLSFPSGMAAISASLFATLKAGDTLLLPSDGYYISRVLSKQILQKFGVKIVQRATADFEDGGFEGIDVALVETPSNPGLDLCDISAISTAMRAQGGLTIVDNTMMTPFGQRPLDLGADIVVASDTKAPGGHSDLLMGHVATRNSALFDAMRSWRGLSGSIPSPQAAWLLLRGLSTLELRFDRMCQNAERVATLLAEHSAVQEIRFPGLRDDPSHKLAISQMNRFGFVVCITLKDELTAEKFIQGCGILHSATSFGGVHSSAERRARWGDDVPAGQVRISVGCEPAEALQAAILKALDVIF